MALSPASLSPAIAFIGGGNMASAIIGGLIREGVPAAQIEVVEPWEPARAALLQVHGIKALAQPGAPLARAGLVVWAVKPQSFHEAASSACNFTPDAVHLSIAAGIGSGTLAQWLGSQRIVRAMPNTPALIGKGMTALFAQPAITAAERASVEQVLNATGELLWVEQEAQLDAVTALSGSGPAYVFFFLEAMIQAGIDMGLAREQAHRLAVGTFAGASELALRSQEPPQLLRERVTSKGGTTHAAITSLEKDQVQRQFMCALHAAKERARELGEELGGATSSLLAAPSSR